MSRVLSQMRRHTSAWARRAGQQYLGFDEMAASRQLKSETDVRKSVEKQLGRIEEELGEYFIEGTVGRVSSKKTRIYDSYWNWASQELVGLVMSLMRHES